MTATATHDTKRGEDARARIAALSEIPGEWTSAVARWKVLNAPHLALDGNLRAPSATFEYMLYQTLLGAWPLGETADAGFVERIQAYALKAAREGKEETSWLNPHEAYENGVASFIAKILDPAQSSEFLEALQTLARRVALLGALNSLSQLTLKATLPGVPDFYQGTEYWDLSLVDPDNRRPVDFAARQTALTSLEAPDWRGLIKTWPNGQLKAGLDAAPAQTAQRTRRCVRAGRVSAASRSGARTQTTSSPLSADTAARLRSSWSGASLRRSRKRADNGPRSRVLTRRSTSPATPGRALPAINCRWRKPSGIFLLRSSKHAPQARRDPAQQRARS